MENVFQNIKFRETIQLNPIRTIECCRYEGAFKRPRQSGNKAEIALAPSQKQARRVVRELICRLPVETALELET